jgi:hypothetical protein
VNEKENEVKELGDQLEKTKVELEDVTKNFDEVRDF